MGYDGSRGSAHDVSDINVIVVAASNQQDISPNIINKVQGTTPGVTAVTAVTSVTCAESGNNTMDTQVFPPTTALQQTKQNAGDIYWSGVNWHCRHHCRHCKISGDKFYMQVHICKGYVHI
jgi:hypothetical protein